MSLQLIVNADDYARSSNISRGIRDAYRRGIIRSTTCMMNFPNAEADILLALEETPGLDMGVHLVLTAGYTLTSPKEIPTLVTDEYRLPNLEQFIQRLPGIDAAQARQMQRIEQGRRSGQLTAAEYHRLVAEQHRIAQLERRAKADGVATRAERYQIRQAQRQASRHIFNEKHDRQARGHFMARRWW